ncbi:hypothetical protein [Micromonospora sp. DT62]|uniref:hypothetical protein n=1 Tax=Micromonospora sp. DT62 TaxID=3416521 RepID=UPI003CEB46DC
MAAIGLAFDRALLVLLTPVGLLALGPLTENVAPVVGADHADFRVGAGTAVAVLLAGAAPLAAALAVRARSGATADTPVVPVRDRCPACGR